MNQQDIKRSFKFATLEFNVWALAYFPDTEHGLSVCSEALAYMKKKKVEDMLDEVLDIDIITALNKLRDVVEPNEKEQKLIRTMFRGICDAIGVSATEVPFKRCACVHFANGFCDAVNCSFSHHPSRFYGFEPFIDKDVKSMVFEIPREFPSLMIQRRIAEHAEEADLKVVFNENTKEIKIHGKNEIVLMHFYNTYLPNLFGKYLPYQMIETSFDVMFAKDIRNYRNMPRGEDSPLFKAIEYCTTISNDELPDSCAEHRGQNWKKRACKFIGYDNNICQKFQFMNRNEERTMCSFSHHPESIAKEKDCKMLDSYWFRDDAAVWLFELSPNDSDIYTELRYRVAQRILFAQKGSRNLHILVTNWITWVQKNK